MNLLRKTTALLLIAAITVMLSIGPAYADDGYLDSDSVTKVDSTLGNCVKYGANLFGNTTINTGFNTNLTTYYSTTAAEKRADSVMYYGTAYFPEARYEKVSIEWSNYWSGGFANPYDIGLANSQSVYTNKNATNTRPSHQILAMAWDFLWNWLGTQDSIFALLPSPTGLLGTQEGSVWTDGGGTWDKKEYIINNNPTEVGVNFKMILTSVQQDGWFYVGANHSAEAGFLAYTDATIASTAEMDTRTLEQGEKSWKTQKKIKDGKEFKKATYSYEYESLDSINREVQDNLTQGYPTWVPSSEVFLWLVGKTTVRVTN